MAFKAILKFVGEDGTTIQYPCTVSDVNGEYYVFPDGQNQVTLPSTHGVLALVDVILSDAGTATSQAEIYYNGKNTGIKILNAANVASNMVRQFTGTPEYFAPGGTLRIKQLT